MNTRRIQEIFKEQYGYARMKDLKLAGILRISTWRILRLKYIIFPANIMKLG